MKTTLLSTSGLLALALLAACNSEPKQETAAADETQHDMRHEEGMHMEDMSHTAEYPIAGMEREAHTAAITPEEVSSLQVSDEAKKALGELTDSYLKLKTALVEAKQSDAAAAAKTLNEQAQALKDMKLEGEAATFVQARTSSIQNEAKAIAEASELEVQRGYFATLSKNVFELNKAIDTGDKSLYFQYCPMAFDNKGGYWLSSEEEIRNPYFGDKMLKCGRVTQTL
jgi:hypothetical protein